MGNMKQFVIVVAFAGALQAQSIAVTTPTANQTVSGYSGFSFQVSLTSAPATARVCYTVDAYPATNPGDPSTWMTGTGALAYAGCSITPSFSYTWNSFWVLNGPHQVIATAYDSLGNVVATSPAVAFKVANTWPCSWNPTLAVTTGTPVTSNWSGLVSVQGTLSGSGATDNSTFQWFVDGIPQYTITGITSGTSSVSVDTTQFSNGPHAVALMVTDTTGCTSYPQPGGNPITNGGAGEWSRTVTFANGAAPMEARSNAHDIYITPNSTFTLTPSLVNTDGSTVTSPTFYYMTTSANCTVGSSTGSSTVITAGSSAGSCPIEFMSPNASATDGNPYSAVGLFAITSTSYAFKTSDVNRMLVVTAGGTGCLTGNYYIGAISQSANFALLNANFASSSSANGCHFSLGPTRFAWALIASTNTLPHFGIDGAIHTTYDPVHSFVMNEGFSSTRGFTDQPYNPGFGADMNASGFNTVEAGITPSSDMSGSIGQSAFASSQSAFMLQQKQTVQNSVNVGGYTIPGCSKCLMFGTGDNLDRSPQSLFGLTQDACSTFNPTCTNMIFSSLLSSGMTWVGVSWMDEINNWGQNPLQGPIRPGPGTNQNWLAQIAASSGVCTATTSTTTPGGKYSFFGPQFAISGSITSNMNSTSGNLYTLIPIDGTHFNFTCTGVPNGTYTSSNDPGLTIQNLSAGGWWSLSTGGTGFLHYDAWATMVNQANTVAGRTLVAGSQAAQTNPAAVAAWEGNSSQSITVGGNTISNISDWADIYSSHGAIENYLTARASTNALINDLASLGGQGPEEGYWLRFLYGTYNPAKPLTTITQGTSATYGYQGPTVQLSSASNQVLTFSVPHGITTVYPGVTRLSCSGTSNSEYNTNLYVTDAPTPTTLEVQLGATDFTGTISGGTLTFQNGDTLTISSASANGSIGGYGDPVTYSAASCSGTVPNDCVNRDRGRTFTLSGTGNTTFNSRTFLYTPQNFLHATDANGSASSTIYFRELPTGSATGGSCQIVADNNRVKGRNGDAGQEYNPQYSFASIIEAAILRAAGHRFYQFAATTQGYVDHVVGSPSSYPWIKAGFTGQDAGSNINVFGETYVQRQLFSSSYFENSYSVPMWHAASIASMMLTRVQKYLLQPALNSPDYGSLIDCGARAGSYGNLLMCLNASEGVQTRTFNLSPYLQSGQQIIRYTVTSQGISLATLAAGTTSDTVSMQPEDALFYVFAAAFTPELQQPTIAAQLSDVPNAAQIVVRYNYDKYFLDSPVSNAFNCGAGSCILPVDRNIGAVYYRLIYLDSNSKVLAVSDVNTL